MHATGGFCFPFVLSKPHVLLQVVRMLHACLRKARASAGASWWTLSSNVKTVTELWVREALHPFWCLWETDQSLLCLA